MSLIKRCFGNLSSMMINDGLKVFEEVCKLLSFHLPKKMDTLLKQIQYSKYSNTFAYLPFLKKRLL